MSAPVDVKAAAEAMRAIADAVAPFRPEQQLAIVAGELGNVLCRVGPKPDRHTAIAMIGTTLLMVVDMIDRHYPERLDS